MNPPVTTYQDPFELDLFLAIYRHVKPRRVLELGTANGGTLWCWARNCEPGTLIVGVDAFIPVYPDNRHLFPKWAAEFGCRIEVVQGLTQDATTIESVRRYAPFDWLFIDADHTLDGVRRDYHNYEPMVRHGGVISFHDITRVTPGATEVAVLWREVKQGVPHVEIVANEHDTANGVGLLFV